LPCTGAGGKEKRRLSTGRVAKNRGAKSIENKRLAFAAFRPA